MELSYLQTITVEVISIALGQILLRSTHDAIWWGWNTTEIFKSLRGQESHLWKYDISFKIDNTIFLTTSLTMKKETIRKYSETLFKWLWIFYIFIRTHPSFVFNISVVLAAELYTMFQKR